MAIHQFDGVVHAPEFPEGPQMAQYGSSHDTGRIVGQDRVARFLDFLLCHMKLRIQSLTTQIMKFGGRKLVWIQNVWLSQIPITKGS